MSSRHTRARFRILTVVAVSALVAGLASAASATKWYSIAREDAANYGVKATWTGPAPNSELVCNGPGPGFVYLAVWQGTNGGDPGSWVEVGFSYCDEGLTIPVWAWAQSKYGVYTDQILGLASHQQSNSYKVKSHEDGKYRVMINAAVVATTEGWSTGAYSSNTADVGLEVDDHQLSVLENRPMRNLLAWPTRYGTGVGRRRRLLDRPSNGRTLELSGQMAS